MSRRANQIEYIQTNAHEINCMSMSVTWVKKMTISEIYKSSHVRKFVQLLHGGNAPLKNEQPAA